MGKDKTAFRDPKRILIVGGGLGGSYLAVECVRAGHQVCLYDQPNPRSASRIAAGLYNIITGKQAVLTWQARTMMDDLHAVFQHPPFDRLKSHLHPMPIYRPYRTAEDFNEWCALSMDQEFAGLVEHVDAPIESFDVLDPMGGLKILPCGWLDVGGFLDDLHGILVEKFGVELIRDAFVYADLEVETGALVGKGEFDQIVFAEGVANQHNPWFDVVDIHPLKGQVMAFEVEGKNFDAILMRKSFIVPMGVSQFVSGSTYEHDFETLEPTEAGIGYLTENAEVALKSKVQITETRAGIRPTTRDRRPVLGRHPQFPRIFMLNGLGTKGVLQGPWCAKMLRRYMDGEIAELPKEVQVERYFVNFGVN